MTSTELNTSDSNSGNKSPPQEGRKIMDKLAEYGKKLNNYVLKNDGDIFELKKLADELNRDFYADIAELKASFYQ